MKKLIYLLIIISTTSCGVLSSNVSMFCSDWENPCTKQSVNNFNCNPCYEWAEQNPDSYKKYVRRMQDYKWVEYCQIELLLQ